MKTDLVLVESWRLQQLIDSIGDAPIEPEQEQEIARILAEDNGIIEVGTAVFSLGLAIDRCKAREDFLAKPWRDLRKKLEQQDELLRDRVADAWAAVAKRAGVVKVDPLRTDYFTQSLIRKRVVVVAPGCSMDDVDPLFKTSEECEKCGGLGRVEKIAKSATEEFDPERPIAGLQMIESAHIQQRKTTRGSELAADLKTSGLLPPGGG
jgi:hypothetical protein